MKYFIRHKSKTEQNKSHIFRKTLIPTQHNHENINPDVEPPANTLTLNRA
jgi:hypothetical protein